MRLRTAKDRLKIEHSIIDGVREILERVLAETPEIRSIIPGVIRPVRDARGPVKVHITVPVQNGWKAIALSAGARQELVHQHGAFERGCGAGAGAGGRGGCMSRLAIAGPYAQSPPKEKPSAEGLISGRCISVA